MSTVLRLLLALGSVTACGGAAGPASGVAPPPALSGTVTVLAAASLTDAFNVLGAEFTKMNPQVRLKPSYAASSALVTQLIQGAEADIFASADEASMTRLIGAKLNEGAATIFASNRLEIIVQAGNPRKIAGIPDLARSDLIVVVAAPQVPVGGYARLAFDRAGITVTPKSFEADVKAVATKVSLGEADAGIVYRTDVKAAGPRVQGVEIPEAQNVIARYSMSLVKGGRSPRSAAAFMELVSSARGREVLASFGFIPP